MNNVLTTYPRNLPLPGHLKGLPSRLPDNFFHRFVGTFAENKVHDDDNDEYNVVKFFPEKLQEHLMVLGSDCGVICIADLRKPDTESFWRCNSAHVDTQTRHLIMDVSFAPNDCTKIITAGGAGELMWVDLVGHKVTPLLGHTKTINQVATRDKQSVFVTVARDGQIYLWDHRYLPNPRLKIANAHKLGANAEIPAVSCVAYLNDNQIATGSATTESSIRIWDIRYQKLSKPMFCKDVPALMTGTRVISMAVDRLGRRMYAVTSAGQIYEYDTDTINDRPLYVLRCPPDRGFRGSCKASPISEHLLVTSSRSPALLYDLQRGDYMEDFMTNNYNPVVKDHSFPRFTLAAKANEEICYNMVDWSANGRFLVGLNRSDLVIYDNSTCMSENAVKGSQQSHTTVVDGVVKQFLHFQITPEYRAKVASPSWNWTLARHRRQQPSSMKKEIPYMHVSSRKRTLRQVQKQLPSPVKRRTLTRRRTIDFHW